MVFVKQAPNYIVRSIYDNEIIKTFDRKINKLIQDLLKIEENEHKILSSYLPKQLSDEETKKICLEAIKAVGASSVKDMGKVMGALKKKYSDVLDFSKASRIIKENLN